MEAEFVQILFPELSGVRKLGRGGQKTVFWAIHPSEGEVVVKIIHGEQDPERIVREIRAVTQVASDRVPRLFAADVALAQQGQVIWLREQYISGEDLRERLTRSTLPLEEAIALAKDVLDVLCASERVRIVHRDVKPDNIRCGIDGKNWLLDFGIARHLDLESLTATVPFGGPATLGYAPLEQIQNKKRDIDARADLFALGITLYESLTGCQPLRDGARDYREVLRRMESFSLDRFPVSDARSERFLDFILTLAQRQREHRPRTADEARTWLGEIEQG